MEPAHGSIPQLQLADRTSLWAEPEMTSAPGICSLGAALRLRPLSRDPHRHSGHAARRSILMKRLTADGSSSAAIQPKKLEKKKRRVHLNNGPGRPS